MAGDENEGESRAEEEAKATKDVQALAESLHRALDARGNLQQLRAQLRAAAYDAVAGGDASQMVQRLGVSGGELPPETVLTNELVAEYLHSMGYTHTLSVFKPEAALGAERLSKRFLASEIGLDSPSDTAAEEHGLPLLLTLVSREQQRKQHGKKRSH